MKNYLKYVGRRGGALLFLALVFLSSGIRFLDEPPADLRNYSFILKLIDFQSIGLICVGLALLMIVGGLWKKLEPLAYSAAATLSLFFAACYVAAWLSGEHTPNVHVSVTIYVAFAGFILMLSGWPESKD